MTQALGVLPAASPRPVDSRRRFGYNLRRLRTSRGVSQERFGFVAGLHRTEISLLERGERDPRLSTILRLAKALDVRVEELLDGLR